jgi:hypothetical protein
MESKQIKGQKITKTKENLEKKKEGSQVFKNCICIRTDKKTITKASRAFCSLKKRYTHIYIFTHNMHEQTVEITNFSQNIFAYHKNSKIAVSAKGKTSKKKEEETK